MSWLKVDDNITDHPKFKMMPRRIRMAASGVWMHCGAWSARHETDGDVPLYIIEDIGGDDEVTAELIRVGLWERTEGGIRFHDWAEYQPTKASKDARRASEAERVRKWRQNKRKAQEIATTSGKSNGVRTEGVTPAYASPDPTRPDPTPTSHPLPPQGELDVEQPRKRGGAFVYPDSFEEFWSAYPRKDDKRRALTAWRRATKVTDNQILVEAAARYRDDPNREDQYTKHATTWLNAEAWLNGPLPARRARNGRPAAGDTHRAMLASHRAAEAYRELEASGYYDNPMRRTA